MSDDFNPAANKIPLISTPVKLNELVVAATLTCYIAGFAITNLHLGSLGIVSFDLLRAKYVVTGILFVFFLGIIAFLIFGLLDILYGEQVKSNLALIARVTWYSVERFILLFLGIRALAALTGSKVASPILAPPSSRALPWSAWLRSAPGELFMLSVKQACGVFVVAFPIAFLIIGIFFAVNPKQKDGTRPSRKQLAKQAFSLRNLGAVAAQAAGVFLFFCVLNTAKSLFVFITENEVITHSLALSSGQSLSEGLDKFLGAIFVLYAIAAAYLVWFTLMPHMAVATGNDSTITVARSFYLVAAIIGVVMPLYSLGVYPNIPQQIGGGRVLPIDVTASGNEVTDLLTDASIEVYLIDRTSNSAILLLANTQQGSQRIIELANSQIQSITYRMSTRTKNSIP